MGFGLSRTENEEKRDWNTYLHKFSLIGKSKIPRSSVFVSSYLRLISLLGVKTRSKKRDPGANAQWLAWSTRER